MNRQEFFSFLALVTIQLITLAMASFIGLVIRCISFFTHKQVLLAKSSMQVLRKFLVGRF